MRFGRGVAGTRIESAMESKWDKRFAEPGFAYGLEPNDFLAGVAHRLPSGPILSLAEGEGRNAVFLAGIGYDVTAVDQSDIGLTKARQLATDRGVQIRTLLSDLGEYAIEPNAWAGIVSIFCHVPPEIRRPLHAGVVRGLRPGGVLILEAYSPRQCGRETGGPPVPELAMSLEGLQEELHGLTFLHARELDREIHEGAYHTGLGSVVQIVARRDTD